MIKKKKKKKVIETDPYPEDCNCPWSNGYPFFEGENRPRGNGSVSRRL